MTVAADSLEIGGNAAFGGATGTLSNGVIRLAGNFTQTGGASFAPGPNTSPQRVVLTGNTGQIISFANPAASFFRRLQAAQGANGAVSLLDTTRASWFQWTSNTTMPGPTGHLIADTITGAPTGTNITVGKVEVSTLLNTGGGFSPDTVVFTGAAQVIPNTYAYRTVRVAQSSGTATFAGNLSLTGSLVVSGGVLDLTGRQVGVAGSLRTEGSGVLRMTGASDSLEVGGAATFSGGASTASNGVLRVAGNFTQTGGATFAASGPQRTVLTGAAAQTVSFADTTNSFFRYLEMNKTTAGVTLGSNLRVTGSLRLLTATAVTGPTARVIVGDSVTGFPFGSNFTPLVALIGKGVRDSGSFSPDTTVFTGSSQVIPFGAAGAYAYKSIRVAQSAGTATFQANQTIPADLVVSSGILDLTGRQILVAGNFRTEGSGTLRMTGATDSLGVGRNATFAGGSTTGNLTAGAIGVGGNFAQAGAATSFAPSTAQRFHLVGLSPFHQTVSFANPATSFFDSLSVEGGIGARDTIVLLSDVRVNRGMNLQGSADVSGPTSRVIIAGGSLRAVLSTTSPTMTNLAIELSATPAIDPSIVLVSPDTMVFNAGIATLPLSSGLVYKNVRVNTGGAFSSPGGAIIRGALIVPNGTYTMGVGIDSVAGFLRTQATGALSMVAVVAAPTLVVGDSAVFAGGPSAALTGGLLRIRGNFVQRGSGGQFAPTGTRVALQRSTTGTQTIQFSDPVGSFFRDLVLNRVPADTVRLLSTVQVTDSAIVAGSTVLASTGTEALFLPPTGVLDVHSGAVLKPFLAQFGTFFADSDFAGGPARIFPDTAVFSNGGTITSASSAYAWKSVRLASGLLTSFGTTYNGNLIVEGGAYDLPNGQDSVGGYLHTRASGVLQMTNAEGETIAVRDSAVFEGGSEVGFLTGGNIRLYGSFVQRGPIITSFAATPGHTTVFAGSGTQTVTFANPGGGGSAFGNLAIERSVGAVSQSAGITLGSNVFLTGSLQDTTFNTTVTDSILGNGFTVTAGGIQLGSQFVMNNARLVTNIPLLQTTGLTFRNMDPTVTQWTINIPPGQPIAFSGLRFETVPTTGMYFAALLSGTGAGTLSVSAPVLPSFSSLNGTTFYRTISPFGTVTTTWDGSPLTNR